MRHEDQGWMPDVLGGTFEQRTLRPDGDNSARTPVATLVRLLPGNINALLGPLRNTDVLYVHGWSDYFFQRELAEFWMSLGARFYALDLHGYGRSLRENDVPGFVMSLDEYDPDIAAALDAREDASDRRLILLGHSTGGLTLSLWAARHPGIADALILNSPWLEFQTGALARQALMPIVMARARLEPGAQDPVVDLGFYTRAQRELGVLPSAPERQRWRPEQGFRTHPGWLAAILSGHAAVAAGIDVACPVLVLLSTRSVPPLRWNPAMTSSDSVLVVDDIARAALRLGASVTVTRIDGAIHDVFLSATQPRAAAYQAMRAWAPYALG